MVRLDHIFRLIFQTLVIFPSIPTKERKSSCWPPLYYYAQSSLAEHIPQQLGQRADISQPQLEREFCPSILHCRTLQTKQLDSCHQWSWWCSKWSRLNTFLQKIQVQRYSKCDLLAPNRVLTAQHLWWYKMLLILPAYCTTIVELWSCSSLFCSFLLRKGFSQNNLFISTQ